jgi:hypothetical protein
VMRWCRALAVLGSRFLPLGVPAGLWCDLAPFWGNPFLANGGLPTVFAPAVNTPACFLAHAKDDIFRLCAISGTHSVGGLRVCLELVDLRAGFVHCRPLDSVAAFQLWPGSSSALDLPEAALPYVAFLLSCCWRLVPLSWKASNRRPPPPGVTADGVVASLFALLCWSSSPPAAPTVAARPLLLGKDWRVRDVTFLITTAARETRSLLWREYVADSLGVAPYGVDGAQDLAVVVEGLAWLVRVFRVAWALPWENRNKEVFWRLSVQGVAGAGGHGVCSASECPCGWRGGLDRSSASARLLRLHFFWGCPVAQAVVQEISSNVPGLASLSCADVWLARPPSPVVCKPVWIVVCLAAVHAMNIGRKLLWKLHGRGARSPSPSQPGDSLRRAKLAVVAHFWVCIQDFVCLNKHGWAATRLLSPLHPFICSAPLAAGVDGPPSLSVRRVVL